MKQLNFFLSTLILLGLYSCDPEELKAPIPAYLEIKDVQIETNSLAQESTSDNVTNVKVFINDQSLGSFQLPAVIPIQRTGRVSIKIAGGIQVNGLSNDILDYPFYQLYELDTVLEANKTYSILPILEFSTIADETPAWSGDNFESGANFDEIPSSDTTLVRTTNPEEVFEGVGAGKGFLTKDQTFFETRSKDIPRQEIPTDGRPVFLEMNYKSTHDISVRVYTNNLSQVSNVVFFRAQDDWKKVYVELSPVLSSLFTSFNFNIAIGYAKLQGVEGKLLLDNVRLIHP